MSIMERGFFYTRKLKCVCVCNVCKLKWNFFLKRQAKAVKLHFTWVTLTFTSCLSVPTGFVFSSLEVLVRAAVNRLHTVSPVFILAFVDLETVFGPSLVSSCVY